MTAADVSDIPPVHLGPLITQYPERHEQVVAILRRYKECFGPLNEHTADFGEDFEVQLIEGAQLPPPATCRYMPREKYSAFLDEFGKLMRLGIWQPSQSPVSSPLVCAQNAAGYRICINLTAINDISVKDRYVPPRVEDMWSFGTGCSLFSKWDCRKGFYQAPLKPSCRWLLAAETPLGRLEPTCGIFGHSNILAYFQRRMNMILAPLSNA